MNCRGSWIAVAGWPKPSSTGMPGKRGLSAAFLSLFWRCLLQLWSGSCLGHVEFTRDPPPSAVVWGQHLLTVKQFPLGHGNLAGGLFAGCTPGAGSSCQAFLPTPRGTVSPEWNTSGCEYWKMKWCAFWGFSHLGKKWGWKVKHCIIFLWWLQTVSVGV